MKVIIMGCGRVGSTLAHQLSVEGHDVCVVDRDPTTRELLPGNYSGGFIVGNGYNRSILEWAGIAEAGVFVAVTSGDNTNIVGARIAKEDYRVPQVVARIYDPRRADIYRELGIPTVASVRWTTNRIRQMLSHRYVNPEVSFGNGETLLVRETLPAWFAGRPLHELEVDGEIRVIAITRGGASFLPMPSTVAEADDAVSFAVAATALDRLRSFLDKELGT
ncbi:TrkA family potassium uptake protein [Kibdelosporangium philippinense]|uniref:Trk system potassium uptake protein TrkA n=1 Tax=Kibdelosporangium philippinense TaxID=211113 RepID=A0ABS8ZCB1_9PSEU|nr:TrkA family potassium uptake protein [Kibdelosporangium philippinense]MCE7004648.1 TrkA family potassium uptake protein [Kibdelosporangium philippinense]